MKPARFDYVRPETVEEAVALLWEHGEEARILAGGQSLMPMLNMRLARPAVVIDIGRLMLFSNKSYAVELGYSSKKPIKSFDCALSEIFSNFGGSLTNSKGTPANMQ